MIMIMIMTLCVGHMSGPRGQRAPRLLAAATCEVYQQILVMIKSFRSFLVLLTEKRPAYLPPLENTVKKQSQTLTFGSFDQGKEKT